MSDAAGIGADAPRALRRARRNALEGVQQGSWRWYWILNEFEVAAFRPGRQAYRISRALALAFLATGPAADPVADPAADPSGVRWRHPDLVRAGGTVLGVRRRWLHPVVDAVLAAYPHAPSDRPRELAAFIAASHAFKAPMREALLSRHSEGSNSEGSDPEGSNSEGSDSEVSHPGNSRRERVRVWLAAPTRTVRRPFHTRAIDDLGALAAVLGLTISELDWYGDRRNINRYAHDQRLRHYRYRWLNGRLIEAPKQRLRALQRQLLAEVIGPIPTHPAVHGFVTGRSPHTFAAPHAGQPVVVRLDITSFFAAITAPRIYGLLRAAGYPEPVAHAITGLCTTRTPAKILALALPGGPERHDPDRHSPDRHSPDRGYRLGLLRDVHLPQGAPTSPALANLCGFRLDRRLSGLADRFGAAYTRYADDLAFSGDLTPHGASALVAAVTAIAADEGFRVNTRKTRVRGRADRQKLAGLVVNERPAVPRAEYDELRALLHNAARTGLDEQNRDGHANFRGYVEGRIAWVGHRHPARAARLAEMLRAVDS